MKNLSSEHSKEKITLDYFVSTKCPKKSRCAMCYMENVELAGEPIYKDTKTILKEIKNFVNQGYSTFLVTDDIFEHSDWAEILNASKQKHVLTTGIKICNSPTIITELREIGIEQVVFTINLESIVKKLNLPGLELTKEATQFVKKAGLSVMYTAMVTVDNYNKVEEIADLAQNLGGDGLRFLSFIPFVGKSNAVTSEQKKEFVESVYRLKRQGKFPKEKLYITLEGMFSGYHQKGQLCNAGKERFVIGLDNGIYPCIFLIKPQFKIGEFDGQKINLKKDYHNLIPYKNSPYCKAWEYFQNETLAKKL